MKILRGLIGSPGLAIGEVYVYTEIPNLKEPEFCVTENPELELDLLLRAKNKTVEALKELPGEEDFIEAYSLMLESLVEEAKELILRERLCSAPAIIRVFNKYDQLLAESGSELINLRRSDLKAIASYMLKYLKETGSEVALTKSSVIVVADELSPLDLMKLKEAGISGIVTSIGGPTSHVAILARSYGIPYLIVTDYPLSSLARKVCIVDALSGKLVVEPDDETLKYYKELDVKYSRLFAAFKQFSKTKVKTIDNIYVKVNCNVGTIEDLRLLDEYGCDGVGLFRVEFMYLQRKKPPSELELLEVFNKVSNLTRGKEVIVRAPDIGADKPVDYINFDGENNPQLGLRGIRLLLKYEDELLIPFLKAFIHGNRNGYMKLLLPMVTSIEEVTRVSRILEELTEELIRKLNTQLKPPSLGIMVETPATIFIMEDIIRKTPVEFISIGTNDLTQYILAADRTNPRLHYLYNELHPAVLRSIEQVVKTVERGEKPVDIEVCGEMASQTRAIPILLALGIRKLSVAPTQVGKVKYYVSNLDISMIKSAVLKAIHEYTSYNEVEKAIKTILSEFRLEYFP